MRQRGQALVMVLIFLGFGAVLLGPVLSYASTALRYYGTSRTSMWVVYAVEGTINEALWKLQYDNSYDCNGVIMPFSDCVAAAGTAGLTWSNTLNAQDVTVTVSVPGALAPPEPSPTPIADECMWTSVSRDQTWAQVNQPIQYTVLIWNCSISSSVKNVRQVRVLLPAGIAYIAGTTRLGTYQVDPQQATCTGSDLPKGGCEANSTLLGWPEFNEEFRGSTSITLSGGESTTLIFQAVALDYGVYFVDASVCFWAAGGCEGAMVANPVKKVAPVAAGLFNLKAQGKGYGVLASVGKGPGGVDPISWQSQ